MSANPDAFSHLREAAYRFVREHGKDAQKLRAHCTSAMAAWMAGVGAGSGLTETEATRLVADVTRWAMKRYNPPRRKPARGREERGAPQAAVVALLGFAEENYGKATVRNAASSAVNRKQLWRVICASRE